MKKLTLAVVNRDKSGSCWARRFRRDGRIPAVLYGKSGNRLLTVSEVQFLQLKKEMGGRTALIEVTDEKNHRMLTLIQGIQAHTLSRKLLNVDFHEVDPNEPVNFTSVVHIKGDAPGVRSEGGMLEVHAHELHVKALPECIPEFLEVDVSALVLGGRICVRDLPAMKGVSIVGDPDQVVVSCQAPRAGGGDTEAKAEAAPVVVAPTAAPAKAAGPAKPKS